MGIGVGENFRDGYLKQGQPLGMVEKRVHLAADNTIIDVDGYSRLALSSDDTTAANRTFTLKASPLVGHLLFIDFVSAASTTAQLVDTGIQKLKADWEPVQYDCLLLVSDGTNWLEITRGPAAVVAGAIGTTELAAGAVTLAKLAAGVTPAHVVKYGAIVTTVGGAASEDFAIPGVLATDLVHVTIRDDGTANVTLKSAVTATDKITVVFSGNPGADCIFNYTVSRAAT